MSFNVMISVEKAQGLVTASIPVAQKETVSLLAALGCVIAEDIKSPLDMPLFDNSAMDGFAFRAPEEPARLAIRGILKAGDPRSRIKPGEAWRIMTGAPIPYGADTVLAQEKAEVVQKVLVLHEPAAKGKNIRYKGEELKKGKKVISRGTAITPATIGILAGFGKTEVEIFKRPRISIIATGSELAAPGSDLSSGKIYDSNSSMVHAALLQMGIHPVFAKRLDDQPKKIKQLIEHALRESDLVILMGGVSAGETDHVRPALVALGVETLFWKVNQKPGKPIYFGKKENTLVFGLPGNPAAVFTCFYEYVYPAIRRFMGFQEPYLETKSLPVRGSIEADPEKALFLKARVEFSGGRSVVTTLGGQSSHMISSLQEANGILVIPSNQSVEEGREALVHLLPYGTENSHAG